MTRRPRLRLTELLVLGAAVTVLVLLLWPRSVAGASPWPVADPALGGASWALSTLGTIALFAPLGFTLAWWSRRPLFAILAGATVTLLCEAAQHWSPAHRASLADLGGDVLGTVAGVAIAVAVGRALATTQAAGENGYGRPTAARRAVEVEVDA